MANVAHSGNCIAYLADGRLFLKVGDADPNEICCTYAENLKQRTAELHQQNDWKHTDGHLGWTVFQNQAWSEVRLFPWTDPSWVGVENAREGVEHPLLSPKRPDPFE